MAELLAVDLGIRTGLALYGDDGRLRWYRSHNFGNPSRLRSALFRLLEAHPDLRWVVLEGGGTLAAPWEQEVVRRGLGLYQISAETWRNCFFYPREQKSSRIAKQTADTMARHVITWAGAPEPTSLRHDAAEAILVGLWGVLQVGWLEKAPSLRK